MGPYTINEVKQRRTISYQGASWLHKQRMDKNIFQNLYQMLHP